MATALKLKNDINKLKAALRSKATPKSFLPKLKSQLEKAEADYESVKAGKKSAPKASKQVKSTMDKLKAIIKKKKYGAYRAQGVDLKKDADIPALPTGKRISKSGNTYYEYRANRIDVKQPPKRYPKLEDGGETAKFEVDDVVFHKGHNTVGIVRMGEERGEVKTDADGNVDVSELEYYNPLKYEAHKNAKVAPSTLKEIEERILWKPFSKRTSQLEKGGYMAKGGLLEIGDMVMVNDSGYVKLFSGFDTTKPAKIISKDKKKVFGKIKYFYGLEMEDGKKPFNNAQESMLTKVSKDGGYMADGGTIDNSGMTPADLQNQIWNLTARIAKLGDIESRAASDEIEMLMKQRKKLQSMALNHGDVVMAQGGELHRSQEEKFKYGGYMAGGNTDKTQEIFFFVKPRLVSELTEKANNEKVELEFIETNEDGNEVYRAELTDSQINDFTKLPLQYDFNYDYAKGGKVSSFFSKAKEKYVQAKDYTKKQIKDKKKQIALEVIDSTKDKVSGNKQKMLLKSVEQIVEDNYAKGGYMADGGEIKDQYEGREPEDIWNSLSKMQRSHFLFDHASEIEARRGEDKGELKGKEISDAMKMDFDSLDKYIRITFENHIREGQYKYGGYMAEGGALEHGLKKGDHIMVVRGNMLGIKNEITGEIVTLNIETGERKESKD